MPGEPVEIDGSRGEGGGQVLRTAAAFSAITGRPVNVGNIRANRPTPGLAAQHIAGLKLLSGICDARVCGATVGSASAGFMPGPISPGQHTLDIGTAGSITLALQAALPALASVEGRSIITLTGGTDVRWSPPLDYCNLVLFPMLKSIGLECHLEVLSRGYFPEGGGKVIARIRSAGPSAPLTPEPMGAVRKIEGIVNITGLPLGIAERIRDSALGSLPDELRELAEIKIEHRESGRSRGVGLVLAATDGQTFIGASSLGERGKPAERVGREAAGKILSETEGAAVDRYASDQLLPYLAIAGGRFSARELTGHASTNIRTIGRFMGDVISVEEGDVVTFSRD